MEQAVTILKQISGFLWGWPALILIAGTGIYLTLILRFLPLRQLGFGFKQMFGPQTGVAPSALAPPWLRPSLPLSAQVTSWALPPPSTPVVPEHWCGCG